MERRSTTCINSDFGVLYPLENFKTPPCEPPKGKQVLERLYCLIKNQKQSVSTAVNKASQEIINLWSIGDSRITLLSRKSVKKKIADFQELFNYV